MKNDDVVVGVNELGIAVVWWSTVTLEPPVRRDTPVDTAVVGAPDVNATGPNGILVGRVDCDHVVIPALIEELVGRTEATLDERRINGVRKQQSVLFIWAGVADLRSPRARVARTGRAEDAE